MLLLFGLFHFARMIHLFCRKKKDPLQQTDPPSIPVDELFPSGEFPEGEIQQYKDELSTKSITSS